MDLTNSLVVWNGGIVGIVRAELEIAKNLKLCMPKVRYCMFTSHGFEEVPPEKIGWLWTEKSIGDGYLKNRSGNHERENKEELRVSTDYFGLEEAYRYSASRKSRFIGGCKYLGKSLPRIVRYPLKLFYKAAVYIKNAAGSNRRKKEFVPNSQPTDNFTHPFGENDLVFSCGWMYSGKEKGFQTVKDSLPNFKIVYLVYDTIIVRVDTKRFYPALVSDFIDYLRWISLNCVSFISGGCTAKLDMHEFQKENELPVLKGYPVRFGSDIMRERIEIDSLEVQKYFEDIGIRNDYIISVGSLDKRKNYETLYRAYTILADRGWGNRPQLIIVGKGDACDELLSAIKQDPRTKNHIVFVSPSDQELSWLYKRAKFAVLASVYEGWSLTLPEALSYGKFVIASDNAPLREIGDDLITYTDTYDPYGWADKIYYYCSHDEELRVNETKILTYWKPTTWNDCANQVADYLQEISSYLSKAEPRLYYDATLTARMAIAGGQISGILRTELMLMKHLHRLHPDICFFYLNADSGYIPIADSSLEPILYGSDIDKGFEESRALLWNSINGGQNAKSNETSKTDRNDARTNLKSAIWFFISCLPENRQNKVAKYCKDHAKKLFRTEDNQTINSNVAEKAKYFVPFKKDSVVFSCGVGYDPEVREVLIAAKEKIGFRYCGVIYDFTPIILPQTHNDETKGNYGPFLEFMSKISDCILYGGKTAQLDGISYYKSQGLPVPQSHPIYFGSDAVAKKKMLSGCNEEAILSARGVNRPFVLIVGTIEARKNHETLYRAYLRMLKEYEDVPQMVFAGRIGWRTASVLETIAYDERVKDKILIFAPSDIELDALYRNCEFTILPSMYEGWSLTLPESYYYEKFCLCCDTPSLKETAGYLAEYIQPFDEVRWSEQIMYYHRNHEERNKREMLIRENWHMITWAECAEQVYGYLNEMINTTNDSIEAEK